MPYERLLVSADSDAEDSDAEESTSTANQVPDGLTGKQSGKVLASFLLSERENSAFAKAFENGIMGPLTAYRLRLSCAAGGGVQRPQARCPRARTGSTSRTTT